MQQVFNFVLDAPGYPVRVANGVAAGSGSSLTATYTLNYKTPPTSLVLMVEGIVLASADSTVLDVFSAAIVTTPQTRTIALGATTNDQFVITAVWSGGGGVLISGSLSATGAGNTFAAASNLVTVHTM